MNKIRLTKEFNFEMAHALYNYDGACRHIHGHSYRLFVTVIGSPLADETNPKHGMVMDFSVLKRIVVPSVVERFDHALVLPDKEENRACLEMLQNCYGNIELVDYQPTCENMIIDIAKTIKAQLPTGVELHHLKLHETATSYAEWYASDNL